MDTLRDEGGPPAVAAVVSALGGHVSGVREPVAGLGGSVVGVALCDPDDPGDVAPGSVVLLLGVRGADARPLLATAGRAGAAAVVVRAEDEAELDAVVGRRAPATVLVGVRPGTPWDLIHALVAAVVGSGRAAPTGAAADLFGLARTLLLMSGGSVSIEDSAHRVLAYAAVPGEIDDLRVRSILDREGPEHYLRILRDRGVYDALRVPEQVTHVPADPDLGWKPRLATGVFLGDRQVGTIWIQQGEQPLSDGAESALLGTSRLAAYLMGHDAASGSARTRSRSDVLLEALRGSSSPSVAAAELGLARAHELALLAVDAVPSGSASEPDPAQVLRIADRLSVWAASYRRGAVVAALGQRVYCLLPAVEPAAFRELEAAVARIAADSRAVLVAGLSARGGPDRLLEAQREADEALELARDAGGGLRVHELERPRLNLRRLLDLARRDGLVHDPRLDPFVLPDGRWDERAEALLIALEHGRDLAAVAAQLNVHPNTLRYRVRRACDVGGFDLADPDERLFLHLALRARPR